MNKKSQLLLELFQKNRDILQNLDTISVQKTYIEETDTLFLKMGDTTSSIDVDLYDDNFVLSYDEDTLEITGFVIPTVKQWLKKYGSPQLNTQTSENRQRYVLEKKIELPVIYQGFGKMNLVI